MPHIHTNPGEIDRTASAYIVHVPSKRVLLRMHDKYHILLVPGGHIENYQTAPEAALQEAWEEVGLRVTLWQENKLFEYESKNAVELVPPIAMNIHDISPEHRHEEHVYFATSETMDIVEPDGAEKSGGCFWLTKEEVMGRTDLQEQVKLYALKALETLAP